MKKMNESGHPTTTKDKAGNTSLTGTNVLDRTLKNSPDNEEQIRGIIHGVNIEFLRETFGPVVDELIADGDLVVV